MSETLKNMSNSYTDTEKNDDENSIMGEVITVTYRSEDTGWTVFKILPDDSKKTIHSNRKCC